MLQDGVAIWIGLGDPVRADRAGRAGAVVDHERLPERFLQA